MAQKVQFLGGGNGKAREKQPPQVDPDGTTLRFNCTIFQSRIRPEFSQQEFLAPRYSPKIDEELIPRLYRLRKLKNMPRTRLVNEIVRSALPPLEEEEKKEELACSNTDKANAGTTA